MSLIVISSRSLPGRSVRFLARLRKASLTPPQPVRGQFLIDFALAGHVSGVTPDWPNKRLRGNKKTANRNMHRTYHATAPGVGGRSRPRATPGRALWSRAVIDKHESRRSLGSEPTPGCCGN